MNVVYLIGNGFDIACGLNTTASSVISAYRKQLKRDLEEAGKKEGAKFTGCSTFLESINENPKSWSDFEIKLGDVTTNFENGFTGAECFEEAFAHFRNFLRDYIDSEQKRIDSLSNDQGISDAFATSLLSFLGSNMRREQSALLESFVHDHAKEDWNINLIIFNYTYLIDHLISQVSNPISKYSVHPYSYRRVVGKPIHIHGSLQDNIGIIVGIDSLDQIKNESFRELASINDSLVKPNVNMGIGELRHIDTEKTIEYADIVVVHGMSIGESDETWWKKIGTWLMTNPHNKLLVISAYDSDIEADCQIRPELYKRRIESRKHHFLSAARVPLDEWEILEERILVVINPNDFNVALAPLIEMLNDDNEEL